MQITDQLEELQMAIRKRLERRHVASSLAIASAIWTAQMKFGFLEESHGEIAERSGRSKATVCTILGLLEKAKLLTVNRSRYRTVHRYVVHPPRPEPPKPSAAPKPLTAAQTSSSGPAAGRAEAIKVEIERLRLDTEPGAGGLLAVKPAAKARIASLRQELAALPVSKPSTTKNERNPNEENKAH